jgi:hypothetical protein
VPACEHRALVPLDRIGSQNGSMTLLQSLPLKCSACGAREVELWLFVRSEEAEAWAIATPLPALRPST